MTCQTYSQNSFTGSVSAEAETFTLAVVDRAHTLEMVLFTVIWSQHSKFLRSYGFTQLAVFQKLLHVLQGTSSMESWRSYNGTGNYLIYSIPARIDMKK